MVIPYAYYQGDLLIGTEFYRADPDNNMLENVSGSIGTDSAQITAEPSTGGGMLFRGTVTDIDQFQHYRDWIAPFLTVRYQSPDGTGQIIERAQQGLFQVMPTPETTYTEQSGTQILDARGPLNKMRARRIGKPYSLATGQNVATAMRTQCSIAGVRSLIPAASDTLPKRRSWPSDATREQVFNDLARSIGYIPAFEDRFGRIRSHKFRKLGDVQPALELSNANANVTGNVVRQTDLSKLFNEVTVIGNDPKKTDAPIYAYRINNDTDSETSIFRLGTAAKPEILTHPTVSDPNLHSQSACDDLADRIMDDAASALVSVTVVSIPFLEWSLDQTLKLNLETRDGDEAAKGIWRIQSLSFGLGKNALMTWKLSKILRWGQAI